ncbi:MAG: MMPL family transporter, partial [Candidatus Kariarchaeaceae archaeon]
MKANHAKVILLIWVVVVVSSIALGSQSLLTSGVQESTQFTNDSTESGKGSKLRNERFNLTSDTISHVIVRNLNNGEDISSNEWRNFTLFLTLHLNETLFDLGYNSIISEPLVSGNPFTEELANSLVSEDKTAGLIYINGEEGDLPNYLTSDIELIRGILQDPQSVYTFAQEFTSFDSITDNFPEISKLSNVQLILTGSAATFSDTLGAVEEIFGSSEVIAVIVVIIILTIVFRSPLGMFIPLLAMIASLFPTYLVTFIMGEFGLLQISDFIPLIIAMIGIAIAVDYNLFSLVRYREEFRKRKAKLLREENWNKETIKLAQQESASVMNKTAGTAVMYSGFAVIIGFLSLILLGDEFGAGMSLSVSVVVIFSILTARTLTPAVLSLFGQYLDWPNVTTRAKSDVAKYKHNKQPEGIWVKWSRLVMKHPLIFLVIGILTMVPFTFLSLDTNLGFDTVKNLPDGTESREGFEILNEKFDLGSLSPYTIVVDTTVENGVFTEDVISATNQLASWALAFETTNNNGDNVTFESVESLSVTTNQTSKEPISMNLTEVNDILSQDDVFFIPDGNSSFIPVPNFEKLKFVEFSLKQYVNIDYKDSNNTLL